MKPLTATELNEIAEMAAAYIAKLNGESETFTIDTENRSTVIAYQARLGFDKGDYYTAPYSWIESEEVTVEGVYDEEGEADTEAAQWLKNMLN